MVVSIVKAERVLELRLATYTNSTFAPLGGVLTLLPSQPVNRNPDKMQAVTKTHAVTFMTLCPGTVWTLVYRKEFSSAVPGGLLHGSE